MSVFDTNVATTDDTTDLNVDDPFAHLVGEGKKFADEKALAKGKLEADIHIKNLERQLAEMREDMDEAKKIDDLMALVREQNKAPENNITPAPKDTTSEQLGADELKALIEKHVSERDVQKTQTQNLKEVDDFLAEKYGETAPSILRQKGSEIGMSVDEMKEVAARNPTAFKRLIGADTAAGGNSALVGTTRRSEAGEVSNVGKRNFEFYQKMRKDKETRKQYYSPKVQAQMMKDAEEMGAAFYNNS